MTRNKKIGIGIGVVILLILFFAPIIPVKDVPQEDWYRLKLGSTKYQVEEAIGKPVEEYTEEREMLDVINLDYQHYNNFYNELMTLPDGEVNELLAGVESELEYLDILHSSVSNGEDIRIYEYNVKKENGTDYEFAYFYRDELIHYSGRQARQSEYE